MNRSESVELTCGCGVSRVHVRGTPTLRFVCHCTICQRFHRAPQADMVVLRADQAVLHDAETVVFDRFKRFLAVDRGACRACADPVVEYFRVPLTAGLAFVPSTLFHNRLSLPSPSMRVFYDTRTADADDDLPRYEGFVASQRAMLPPLLRILRATG